MTFLLSKIAAFSLSNWKYIVIGVLLAGNALFWNLWQSKSAELAIFRAEVNVLAEQAELKAKEIEAHQQKVLEDVSNAWNSQLPAIRKDAVDAYKRRYPNIGLRLPTEGGCVMPRTTGVPQGANGTSEEQVVVGAGFIQDSAQDALTIEMVRKWVRDNNLPVR